MANGTEIALSVTAAAIALSNGLEPDETALLGSVFTQLGDTLTTISIAASIKKPDPSAESGSQV
ncbi:MAG: hypothetical protein FWG31_09775 [Oscillospiraceae bacterium]|nr:hypothetical protein [Oscillospiraceae bacterium]